MLLLFRNHSYQVTVATSAAIGWHAAGLLHWTAEVGRPHFVPLGLLHWTPGTSRLHYVALGRLHWTAKDDG